MPRMMAPGVLIRLWFGRCRAVKIPLMTPLFSRRVCHARVRSRKFIHIGRMKMKTMKLPWPMPRLRRIMASG